MKKVAPEIQNSLSSLIEKMGYEFVGCEWTSAGSHSVLRIYIDKNQGITVDDCSAVSHAVSEMLDREDPIPGQYLLEISSPGLDRPLFLLAHYENQLGQRLKLRLHTTLEARRKWEGKLLRVDDEKIYLLADTGEIVIPFSFIEKGNVISEK